MLEQTLFSPGIALILGLAGIAALVGRAINRPAPLMFLLTGLIAGPVLGIATGSEAADLLSEFGLIFLLFLIGLDLKFARIRPLLKDTLWVSPAQMIVTFLVFYGLSTLFFQQTTSLIIGIAMTYSSTAVVLQMLAERNEVDTEAGRLDMSLLLFEDLTVILIIAMITAGGQSGALTAAIGTAIGGLAILGAVSFICIRFLLPHILARSYDQPHGYFIKGIGTLFLFLGITDLLSISPEIGAFFAGLSLAQLPGNEELHERVRPLTALFMALFFIGLSLQLTSADLLAHLHIALLFSTVVLIDKFLLHLGLFSLAGYSQETSFRGAVNMTQVSEFSLVLGATALSAGLIGTEIIGLFTVIALLTMMASTVLIDEQERLYSLIGEIDHGDHRETDILLIGFGEPGPAILDVLEKHADDITIVDPSLRTGTQLTDTPHHHVLADIEHEEIKREAGFYTAHTLVALTPTPQDGLEILESVPADTSTIMIAPDPETAEAFRNAGASLVLDQKTLGSKQLQQEIRTILGGDDDG